ncbi:MAG: TPM domain-containing protein [Clostridia bacterium]|nr:TPM domain-containing protein [Clostridia bacterium]
MKKRIGILFVILLLALSLPAQALDLVTDRTGRHLSRNEISELTAKSQAIFEKHGIKAVYLITESMGEDLYRMRDYAANTYDDAFGNHSDGVIFFVAGRSYISVTTGKGETILVKSVLNAIEDEVVEYLRDGDYAGAISKYLDDLDSVLTRYENGERFDPYTFSLRTPIQRAIGMLPVIAVVCLIISLLVLLIRRSHMKTAKKKETAFDYLSDARLTRRADVYLYTTTVRRKIETSSSSSFRGGGGHFTSSGGGSHGSSSGGHF